MTDGKAGSLFWENMIRAAEAEPRDAKALRGASGFSHPVVGLGVDGPRRRVVIVSGEGDARSAAMAQGDIQAAMPSVNVVMVRPVAVNLGLGTKLLSEAIGRVEMRQGDLDWILQHPDEVQERSNVLVQQLGDRLRKAALLPFSAVPLNILGVVKDVLQQLALIETLPDESRELSTDQEDASTAMPTLSFARLSGFDPVEADRRMGVCSIPLYELSAEEVEDLHRRPNDEQAREVLRRHDVLQYFFPAADLLALGLLDRDPVRPNEILNRLIRTPDIGHPFGALELIDAPVSLNEVVCVLQERGLLVEGEAAVEVTPSGRSARAKVSFKPREGLISKLLQRFSIKVDLSLKDLFK